MIKPNFKKQELMPVITQDYKTGKVLMLAYMNDIAWKKTLETGKVWYYSRSRQKQWMKGESSGNIQEVKEILIDCDEDTILIKINQIGKAACHEGIELSHTEKSFKVSNPNITKGLILPINILSKRTINPAEKKLAHKGNIHPRFRSS